MKTLTRTIIVLVVINLTMGNFALAQEATSEAQPTTRSRRRVPEPTPIEPSSSEPVPEPEPMLPGPMATERPELRSAPVAETAAPVPPMPPTFRPQPMRENRLSQIRSRKVLVIPSTDVEAENLAAITEDLQVMSHIFDEKFTQPREIKGVFVDFGDIFGRDSRSTEAIYIQGYGTLFLMEVNFAFSPEPEPQEKETKKTEEYVDPDWQRAKQKLFSPKGFGGSEFVREEKYSADKIDQLKTELIRTLKHAANIRNLRPDEWVILTVIGKARQDGGVYRYNFFYEDSAPRPGASTPGRSGRTRGSSSSSRRGMFGGGGGMSGGSYGTSGRMSGGMGGGMGGMGGGMMGGGMGAMYSEDYSETGSASATVLTIRAKVNDVLAFARTGDFEQFQEKVEIFTY